MQPSAAQLPSWPSTWILNMSSQLCLPAPPGYAPWVQACTCKSENVQRQLICYGAIQVTRQIFYLWYPLSNKIADCFTAARKKNALKAVLKQRSLKNMVQQEKTATLSNQRKKAIFICITTRKSAGGRDPPNSGGKTSRQAEGQLKVPAQTNPGRDYTPQQCLQMGSWNKEEAPVCSHNNTTSLGFFLHNWAFHTLRVLPGTSLSEEVAALTWQEHSGKFRCQLRQLRKHNLYGPHNEMELKSTELQLPNELIYKCPKGQIKFKNRHQK